MGLVKSIKRELNLCFSLSSGSFSITGLMLRTTEIHSMVSGEGDNYGLGGLQRRTEMLKSQRSLYPSNDPFLILTSYIVENTVLCLKG